MAREAEYTRFDMEGGTASYTEGMFAPRDRLGLFSDNIPGITISKGPNEGPQDGADADMTALDRKQDELVAAITARAERVVTAPPPIVVKNGQADRQIDTTELERKQAGLQAEAEAVEGLIAEYDALPVDDAADEHPEPVETVGLGGAFAKEANPMNLGAEAGIVAAAAVASDIVLPGSGLLTGKLVGAAFAANSAKNLVGGGIQTVSDHVEGGGGQDGFTDLIPESQRFRDPTVDLDLAEVELAKASLEKMKFGLSTADPSVLATVRNLASGSTEAAEALRRHAERALETSSEIVIAGPQVAATRGFGMGGGMTA